MAARDDVDWLAEFLAPSVHLGQDTAGSVPVTVQLEGSQPRKDAVPASAELRQLLVRDSSGFAVPCVTDRDGTLTAWHAAGRLVVSPDRRHVTIRPHDPRGARQLLLLTVRELFMSSYWQEPGGLILHAAAVGYEGVTLVLCGPRKAGKTTLACRISLDGGTLIANDRVALGEGGLLRSVPTIVAVRAGTVELLSLHIPWAARNWQYLRAMAELQGLTPGAWPSEPVNDAFRWTLSPPQLAAVLGAPLGTASDRVVLVFPEVDLSASGANATRLAGHQTRRRLAEQVLGRPGARTSEVLEWPGRPIGPALTEQFVDRTLDENAERLPGFHLRLGHGWDRLTLGRLLADVCSDPVGDSK